MHLTNRQRRRSGFTLVELLVVIAVIAILAGFAIPAVMRALKTARGSSMRTELETLNQGIESYRNKYGDYPPDFSSWSVVQRHYLKIFPDIDQAELTLLYRMCDSSPDNAANQSDGTAHGYPGSIMDRGEALVWSLGGFSSDPQHPFTGTGGPLSFIPGSTTGVDEPISYQYNVERDNRFVEFEPARLSVVPFDPTAAYSFVNRTRSGDEPPASYNSAGNFPAVFFLPDLFPSYVLYKDASPAVYFDARTYGYVDDAATPPAPFAFNGFARFVDNANDVDGVRPVYSETPNPPPASGAYGTLAASVAGWKFMNPQTFQLLAPGLDRRYGAVTDIDGGSSPANAEPVYFQFKTGAMIRADETAAGPADLLIGVKRYDLTAPPIPALKQVENHFLDNQANFCEKTFGDDLK